MCKECGCGQTGHNHVHAHTGPDGKVYYHTHEEHVHDAEVHEHHHEPESGKTVTLGQAILAENDHIAAHNRAWFVQRGLRVFNLISSPGSGKTTLLVKTLERLKAKNIPCAVIVGDQYGEIDAERMRVTGVPVTQIQVHDSCHLTAQQVNAVLEKAIPADTKIVFIENVGNLVCPVAFDLGEQEKIALLSTPEGEEKPLKYPGLFSAAHLVLLTKSDLSDALGWDREQCRKNIRMVNPGARILEVSARTEAGLDGWISYLEETL